MEVVIGAGDGVSCYMFIYMVVFYLSLTPMVVVTGPGDGVSSYVFISMVLLSFSTITDAYGGCYWCWRWSK